MTNAGNAILVVDDEVAIRRILKVCLSSSGYTVHESASGHEALKAIEEIQPDLVLLDLGLPDMDGSKVVTKVRESNQCPILVLSIRDQESAKVTALDAGADDYLTKPFGNRELLARIRALLRRGSGKALTTSLNCGPFTIDAAHHRVQVADKPVRLTPYRVYATQIAGAPSGQCCHASSTRARGVGRHVQRTCSTRAPRHDQQSQTEDRTRFSTATVHSHRAGCGLSHRNGLLAH